MTKLTKKKRKIELPYWPSKDFMDKAMRSAREKGATFTDEALRDALLLTYWRKRERILKENE